MAIKVTVKMDGVGKKLDAICKNQALGQYMADRGREFMNERYVPRLQGVLRGSAVSRPFKITWNTPYAHRQWEGKGITNRTTPGTISHWEEPKAVAEYIAQEATKYLKRL